MLYVLQVSLKYVVNRDSDAYIHDVVEGHDLNVGCTLRLWSSTRFRRGNQSAGKVLKSVVYIVLWTFVMHLSGTYVVRIAGSSRNMRVTLDVQ